MKRKIVSVWLAFCCLLMALVFVACGGGESEGTVYQITKSKLEGSLMTVEIRVETMQSQHTLTALMEKAKQDGELTFEIAGGMVTSIEGQANAADFSSCWMLYTTDTEMSNDEWGTYQYGDIVYGSAIIGADSLIVAEGESYLWVYVAF